MAGSSRTNLSLTLGNPQHGRGNASLDDLISQYKEQVENHLKACTEPRTMDEFIESRFQIKDTQYELYAKMREELTKIHSILEFHRDAIRSQATGDNAWGDNLPYIQKEIKTAYYHLCELGAILHKIADVSI
nr:hypothetical protein [Cacao mild mosaic virus]